MAEQASFFEKVRARKRKRTKPSELAAKISVLVEWFAANKPQVKLIRISPDDAWSLREAWKANEIECRTCGFHITDHEISFRGFDLQAVEG